ncbi:MAG TPA: hypothetical protein VGU64_04235 [Terriglobales bacterium]|nr:hypothetical protein [Terriglobales bacterium]
MEKQQKNRQQRGLKNFVKGDSRINRNGRPRGFDALRKKAQEIASEMVTDSVGNKMRCVEAMLRSLAKSSDPVLQRAFIEYAFGKVPDKLETNPLENKKTLILHYGHEFKRLERDRLLGDDNPPR